MRQLAEHFISQIEPMRLLRFTWRPQEFNSRKVQVESCRGLGNTLRDEI